MTPPTITERAAAYRNAERLAELYQAMRFKGDVPAIDQHTAYVLSRHALTVCERLGVAT